jgi:hypothetical protein
MRDHLLAVQEIVPAIPIDDFARTAGRIGYSEQMAQVCTHVRAGAPDFTEKVLHFHHTAGAIAIAARERDRAAVMQALGAMPQTCAACHASLSRTNQGAERA